MPPKTTIQAAVNTALDAAYSKQAGPMLAQITALSRARTSKMQAALKALDEEAERLDAEGKKMTADNPVLEAAMRAMAGTFESTASLVKANDNRIETSGRAIAVPAVTAKVFLKLSGQVIAAGGNPVSAQALAFYRREIEKSGAKWRLPK